MHFNRKKIKNLTISPKSKNKNNRKYQKKQNIKPVLREKIVNKNSLVRSYKFHTKKPETFNSFPDHAARWVNLLSGHTAFILANSPSIVNQNLQLLNDYFTIGINRIFYIYDPTILMWQDPHVWMDDKKLILGLNAIKFCKKGFSPKRMFPDFKVQNGWYKFQKRTDIFYGTGNTTALAIQFAVALGCKNIVLLGTDCKYKNKKTDFYGKNKDHQPYTLGMCKNAMKWAKESCPIPIYNCSENILWKSEKIEGIISRLKPEPLGRSYYMEKFNRK